MYHPLPTTETTYLSKEQIQKIKRDRALEIREKIEEEKRRKQQAKDNNELGDDDLDVNALGVSLTGHISETGFRRFYKGFYSNEELHQTDPTVPMDENQNLEGRLFKRGILKGPGNLQRRTRTPTTCRTRRRRRTSS